MQIHVPSEISPLKKVLLQRPGKELEHLSPETMNQLLFDDIPYLLDAQKEHDAFAKALSENGVEVCYLETLAAETLMHNPDLKDGFIQRIIDLAGNTALGYQDALKEYLGAIADPAVLVRKTIEGVTHQELFPNKTCSLSSRVSNGTRFLMPPVPNLYFTRDPFACIGNGVSLNRMFSSARNRETVYGEYILKYHPDFSGSVPLYYEPQEYFHIEGGDILNLSSTVLAVGLSQRTQSEAVEILARNVFSNEDSRIEKILVFEIPKTRAFMHLDTVFTQVDTEKFTVHPGILGNLHVYEITGRGSGKLHISIMDGTLEKILANALHLDKVQLITCGGSSVIAADREQWNDGSNTLCIRPGLVIVYDRNYVTNRLLEDNGIRTLRIHGAELSRGRGGPRCMTMPLVRE